MTTTVDLNTGILFSKSSNLRVTVGVFLVALIYLLLRVPSGQFFLESDDQGYQMALGMAVATGRYPGFDFVSQYGPFVAFTSWLAYAVSGNLIGEIVLCAGGYAVTIALIYRYLARHANMIAGVIGAIAVLILFSRYYKWYYWLLPIATLVLSDTFMAVRSSGSSQWRTLAGWGTLIGVSGLFRYDLLIEGAVFGMIVIAVVELTPRVRLNGNIHVAVKEIIVFGIACAIPPVLYSLLILAARGWHQLALVLYSVVDGAVDTVAYYGIAPFQVITTGSLGVLQIIIPLIYVAALLIAAARLWDGKTPAWQRDEAFPLFCTALMGLGLFPQALHRADVQHLLQVLPPFIMTLVLLVSIAVNAKLSAGEKFGAVIAFALIVAILLPIAPQASSDLRSPTRNPLTLWPSLAGLPETAAADHPIADMASAIKRLTPPEATVFMVMPQSRMPMLFFAHRHQPGLFPTYEARMFSGLLWLRENAARLKQTPPDYLVLQRPINGRPQGLSAPYIPDLLAEWQRTYRTVVYENEWFFLLARSQ
jgi:hypothetical protein